MELQKSETKDIENEIKQRLTYIRYASLSFKKNYAADKIADLVFDNLNNEKEELKVLELGTGVGAITIPTAIKLHKKFPQKNISWVGFEKDLISLACFKIILDKSKNKSFWENFIINLNAKSDEDYTNNLYKELESVLKDAIARGSKLTNGKPVKFKYNNFLNFTIYNLDLEVLPFCDITQQWINEKYDILFISLLFMNLVHWKRVFNIFEKLLVKNGLLINAILAKDWEKVFDDYFIPQNKDKRIFEFFKELWDKNCSAPLSFKDYRACNIFIFEKLLRNVKYEKIDEIISEPPKGSACVNIDKDDLLNWTKNKLWSFSPQFSVSPNVKDDLFLNTNFPKNVNKMQFYQNLKFLIWKKNINKKDFTISLEDEIDLINFLHTGHIYEEHEKNSGLIRTGIRLLASTYGIFEDSYYNYGTLVLASFNEKKPWFGPYVFVNSRRYINKKLSSHNNTKLLDSICNYLYFILYRKLDAEKSKENFLDLTAFICKTMPIISKVPYIINIKANYSNNRYELPKLQIKKEPLIPQKYYRTLTFNFVDDKSANNVDRKTKKCLEKIEKNRKEIVCEIKKEINNKSYFFESLEKESYLVVPHDIFYSLLDKNNIKKLLEENYKEFNEIAKINSNSLIIMEKSLESLFFEYANKNLNKQMLYTLCYTVFNSLNFANFIGFPILIQKGANLESQGLIWLHYSKKQSKDEFISKFLRYSNIIFKPILSSIALVKLQQEKSISYKHALRSAVAAIMARNMSHNIGSHVLFYLTTKKFTEILGTVSFKEKNDISTNFSNLCNCLKKILTYLQKRKFSEANEKIKSLIRNLQTYNFKLGLFEWIEDIKIFLQYIQHRMDFISQMPTEWPTWVHSAWFVKDIIRNFLMQRHLLDGIARSEDLEGFYYDYKTQNLEDLAQKKSKSKKELPGKIKINVLRFKQNSSLWGDNQKTSVDKRIKDADFKLLVTPNNSFGCDINNDIPVAIPGGIVGFHAFYIILEDIVRNAAKHNYDQTKHKHLEIVIEIMDAPSAPDDKWLVRIYDNVSTLNGGKNSKMIDDSVDNPNENLIAYINKCLRTCIIGETGEVIQGNWGIAEMKISACYLQKRGLDKLGDTGDLITGIGKSEEDFVMRAICSPIKTFGYEFYLLKPKEVGIICR